MIQLKEMFILICMGGSHHLNLQVMKSQLTVNYMWKTFKVQGTKQEILLSEMRQSQRLESINLKLFIKLQSSIQLLCWTIFSTFQSQESTHFKFATSGDNDCMEQPSRNLDVRGKVLLMSNSPESSPHHNKYN